MRIHCTQFLFCRNDDLIEKGLRQLYRIWEVSLSHRRNDDLIEKGLRQKSIKKVELHPCQVKQE